MAVDIASSGAAGIGTPSSMCRHSALRSLLSTPPRQHSSLGSRGSCTTTFATPGSAPNASAWSSADSLDAAPSAAGLLSQAYAEACSETQSAASRPTRRGYAVPRASDAIATLLAEVRDSVAQLRNERCCLQGLIVELSTRVAQLEAAERATPRVMNASSRCVPSTGAVFAPMLGTNCSSPGPVSARRSASQSCLDVSYAELIGNGLRSSGQARLRVYSGSRYAKSAPQSELEVSSCLLQDLQDCSRQCASAMEYTERLLVSSEPVVADVAAVASENGITLKSSDALHVRAPSVAEPDTAIRGSSPRTINTPRHGASDCGRSPRSGVGSGLGSSPRVKRCQSAAEVLITSLSSQAGCDRNLEARPRTCQAHDSRRQEQRTQHRLVRIIRNLQLHAEENLQIARQAFVLSSRAVQNATALPRVQHDVPVSVPTMKSSEDEHSTLHRALDPCDPEHTSDTTYEAKSQVSAVATAVASMPQFASEFVREETRFKVRRYSPWSPRVNKVFASPRQRSASASLGLSPRGAPVTYSLRGFGRSATRCVGK